LPTALRVADGFLLDRVEPGEYSIRIELPLTSILIEHVTIL